MTKENIALRKESERYKHYESMTWNKRHNLGLEIFKKLPKGKVLEIGCADGLFLNKLKELGFDVYGIDIYPQWVEKCRTKGINTTCGDVNNKLPYKDVFFDYVINFETIAHLIDPTNFAREVKRVLKKSGKFIIESTNSAYWKYRISYLFAQTKNYEMLWPGCESYNTHYNLIWPEHKSMHFQHYSLNSCKEMLEDNGFHVNDISKQLSENKLNKVKSAIFPNFFCSEYMFIAKPL